MESSQSTLFNHGLNVYFINNNNNNNNNNNDNKKHSNRICIMHFQKLVSVLEVKCIFFQNLLLDMGCIHCLIFVIFNPLDRRLLGSALLFRVWLFRVLLDVSVIIDLCLVFLKCPNYICYIFQSLCIWGKEEGFSPLFNFLTFKSRHSFHIIHLVIQSDMLFHVCTWFNLQQSLSMI